MREGRETFIDGRIQMECACRSVESKNNSMNPRFETNVSNDIFDRTK